MKSDVKVFFGGHSLGGAVLQDYIKNNAKSATGQILMGSFLLHEHHNNSYTVIYLTLVSPQILLRRSGRRSNQDRYSWKQLAMVRKVDFNVIDSPSLCAEMNRLSYNWAMKNAGPYTLSHFT